MLGTGTLTITAGSSGAFAVSIDAENNTLAGIRDAINDAPNNTGVLATIINGVDGSRLILTGAKTGLTNPITVTEAGGDGGLAPLVYDPLNLVTNLTEVDPAQDARILINGFAVESSSNTLSTAVDGLEMIVSHMPRPPAIGMHVELDVTAGTTLSGERRLAMRRAHVTLPETPPGTTPYVVATNEVVATLSCRRLSGCG